MARQVLPVIGAAIGAYFGGSTGAQIGWAIGSMVGNAVDPLVVKGPQIGDIAQQTSQEGVPRPIVFALSPPMAGNIVACSDPVIKKKKEKSGKGGPVTETQQVFRTYAIAVCEGPINSFIRVWRNGSLVYDARPGHVNAAMNAKFLHTARFFLGSYSQSQSTDLVAKFRVPATPFMRGTAYMVMANEDLTNLQGAVPQYSFQVLRCEGSVLTSQPYSAYDEEPLSITASLPLGNLLTQPGEQEKASISSGLAFADLQDAVVFGSYTAPPEQGSVSSSFVSGDLVVTTSYGDYLSTPEQASAASTLVFGELVVTTGYQFYTIPTEATQVTTSLVSGALT